MVQCEFFLLALKTMTTKYPDHLPALSTPTITNKILATTFQDHQHPPCTGKWDLASSQKLDIGSLSLSLQFIILCGDQDFNLGYFHNNKSISLIATEKTNIEVILTILDQ